MLKLNRRKTISLTVSGLVFAVIALLVFIFLPTSDLANSIDYSAKSAIYVLAISPIASLLSFALYFYAMIKDYIVWCKALSKLAVTALAVLFVVFSVCSFITYITYFISQVSLGFVAPYTGTAYEYLAIVTTIVVIHEALLTALSTTAVLRK